MKCSPFHGMIRLKKTDHNKTQICNSQHKCSALVSVYLELFIFTLAVTQIGFGRPSRLRES